MHSGEQYLPENTLKRSTNHETVMIWTAMRADGCMIWCFVDDYHEEGTINTANAYCRLLHDFLSPIYEPGYTFQHDNFPIYTAKKVKALLKNLGIWLIDHPPYNSDLNSIEHLWVTLKDLVIKLHSELKEIIENKKTKKLALKVAIQHAFEVLLIDNE